MRKSLIKVIFLLFLLTIQFVIKTPKVITAQEACKGNFHDNCDGSNTNPDACPKGKDCVWDSVYYVWSCLCSPCHTCTCLNIGQPCTIDDQCCTLTCDDVTKKCVSGSACTISHNDCNPATGFGIDGPCCPPTSCRYNPFITNKYWCGQVGDVCRATGGSCKNPCAVDEQPIDQSKWGPNSDCSTGQICCVFKGYPSSGLNQKLYCDNSNPPKATIYNTGKIFSAIGCIPVEFYSDTTKYFLQWGIGIGGGIAFILIVYSGFLIITSSGDPQRLSAGKELLGAALMGIIMLIFSVYILRVIGIDIIKIPGLQ